MLLHLLRKVWVQDREVVYPCLPACACVRACACACWWELACWVVVELNGLIPALVQVQAGAPRARLSGPDHLLPPVAARSSFPARHCPTPAIEMISADIDPTARGNTRRPPRQSQKI